LVFGGRKRFNTEFAEDGAQRAQRELGESFTLLCDLCALGVLCVKSFSAFLGHDLELKTRSEELTTA
jgi:hypothetical protein